MAAASSESMHRLPHYFHVQLGPVSQTFAFFSHSTSRMLGICVHLSVFAEDFLESGLAEVSSRAVLLPSNLDLEAQVGDRQLVDVLCSSLLVDFELHLIDLLDVIDG